MICLFIFRRDLRLDDNTGLIRALQECDEVIPAFIIDLRQVGDENEYKSDFALNFMFNSLNELNEDLKARGAKLHVYNGIAEEVVKGLIKDDIIDAVYFNEDYTPFSKMRDEIITQYCLKNNKAVRSFEDYLLVSKEDFKNYRNFTSFYNAVKNKQIRKPLTNTYTNYYKKSVGDEVELPNRREGRGGRKEGIALIERAKRINYDRRDYPAEDNVTFLSPHLKFGTVSVREVYHSLSDNQKLVRQLYWRDFYTLLAYYNERVFYEPLKKEYKCIEWENNEVLFKAWTEGRTGYPIIDAGMRQLSSTGYMHNRVRMLTAFFLVKVLLIDWRIGEKYFATKLIDYDPAVNNGNWQWVASVGTDYIFRVFDPWKQQKIYDPDAKYIKKWVKELSDYNPEIIHNAYKYNLRNYPKPIVDWRIRVNLAKKLYDKCKQVPFSNSP
ncbi:deoxyribodipyrimidine photo-lyase [Sulfolobus tengchongensis]|uniref:Deoxyribodipyrimidine photo-lyase n=1 Tax=Sulfolobus tengchongensis TaxID=207809 RepID=A0AAX4L4Z1_9CREN